MPFFYVPFIYHPVDERFAASWAFVREIGSNSCVCIILRETCDKCISLRCIRRSRVSFLSLFSRPSDMSRLRICRRRSLGSITIHPSYPSIPFRPAGPTRKFILYSSCRVYVFLFARRDARRCLSWAQFIWDCLTDCLTCKITSGIVFSVSRRTGTPKRQLNMIIT